MGRSWHVNVPRATVRDAITSALSTLSMIRALNRDLGFEFLKKADIAFLKIADLLRELDDIEESKHGLSAKKLAKIEVEGVIPKMRKENVDQK